MKEREKVREREREREEARQTERERKKEKDCMFWIVASLPHGCIYNSKRHNFSE